MQRYYLAAILGTGTREDPYRSAVADHGVPYSACIASLRDGTPAGTWSVVAVDTDDDRALKADPKLVTLSAQAFADIGRELDPAFDPRSYKVDL